jgi:pyruvate/2-oxoglutarate dehydrogenase complex dihydrolipoamide dehydrogenase (E3) component
MMDVDFLPQHLVILGGSYIGLEFGQMYRRFGSNVTIIEAAPRIVGREDEDVSQAIHEIFTAEGIEIRANSKVTGVEKAGREITVQLDTPSGPAAIRGSHLLVAVGRIPNTADLGLDKAGVVVDSRGYITVDEELRTNVSHIGALGY